MNTAADSGTAMKQVRLPNAMNVWTVPAGTLDARVMFQELFRDRCYEQHGISVKDGFTIFDIGANIGMFTLSLMERFSDLTIHCFEPVPATCTCLTRNVTESSHSSRHYVKIHNFAFGDRDTDTTIEFFPNSPANSTIYSGEKRRELAEYANISFSSLWKTSKLLSVTTAPFRRRIFRLLENRVVRGSQLIPCRVRTLSDFIAEHHVKRIDLLKIDVEGAELDVLAGLTPEDWARVRQIAMEVGAMNKPRLNELEAQMKSLGFVSIERDYMLNNRNLLGSQTPIVLYARRADDGGA